MKADSRAGRLSSLFSRKVRDTFARVPHRQKTERNSGRAGEEACGLACARGERVVPSGQPRAVWGVAGLDAPASVEEQLGGASGRPTMRQAVTPESRFCCRRRTGASRVRSPRPRPASEPPLAPRLAEPERRPASPGRHLLWTRWSCAGVGSLRACALPLRACSPTPSCGRRHACAQLSSSWPSWPPLASPRRLAAALSRPSSSWPSSSWTSPWRSSVARRSSDFKRDLRAMGAPCDWGTIVSDGDGAFFPGHAARSRRTWCDRGVDHRPRQPSPLNVDRRGRGHARGTAPDGVLEGACQPRAPPM